MMKNIIVIGGGMAGTSAAYHLTKRGYEITIIEQNNRLGGRVRSEMIDGVAVEYGAGFITNMYANMLRFLKEQGLAERLFHYRSLPGIFRNGRVRMLSFATAFTADVLSWRAKILLPVSLFSSLRYWNALDPLHAAKLAAYDRASIADHYSSVSYVGRTYQNKDVRGNRTVVVPSVEGLSTTCIAVLRAPGSESGNSDVASVKVSAAGTLYEQGDDVVLHTLDEESARAHSALFIENPAPLSTFTWHWEEALPILEMGYFKRLKEFLTEEEKSIDPLVFAGDYLSQPSMEAAFASGMRAAEMLDQKLR